MINWSNILDCRKIKIEFINQIIKIHKLIYEPLESSITEDKNVLIRFFFFFVILPISSPLARFFIFIKRVKMEFRNGSHDSKDRTVLFEDIGFSPFRNRDPSQSLPTPTSVYRADATGSVRHDVIRMYITLGISFTSVTYGRKALNDQNAICGKHGPGIGK